MGDPEATLLKLKEFIEFNEGTVTQGVMWDALKAFLRGLCIQQVAKIKKVSREWENRIWMELENTEKEYIENPTLEKQRIWLNKQQEYRVEIRKSENKRLFQKQVAFGEGESFGRMIAHLEPIPPPPQYPRLAHLMEKFPHRCQ